MENFDPAIGSLENGEDHTAFAAPIKVIIDTDPGIDDSMTILMDFQTSEVEVLGLTTVFGNVSTEDATRNALLLDCEIAGHPEVPVAEGSHEPLKDGPTRPPGLTYGSTYTRLTSSCFIAQPKSMAGGKKPDRDVAPLPDSVSATLPSSGGHDHPAPPPSYSFPYPIPYASPWDSGAGGGYFPPGTPPKLIMTFQAVDRDRNGFIDESELQEALSSSYHRFSIRTVWWLMFLSKNPNNTTKMGPIEFATLWVCLGQWQAIFYMFDRDRSGKINSIELRDALISLGYAVPPSVIQLLVSNYADANARGELNFDNFVECGIIVKGLTEMFKWKDPQCTGSATFSYDEFMAMAILFIVP